MFGIFVGLGAVAPGVALYFLGAAPGFFGAASAFDPGAVGPTGVPGGAGVAGASLQPDARAASRTGHAR